MFLGDDIRLEAPAEIEKGLEKRKEDVNQQGEKAGQELNVILKV